MEGQDWTSEATYVTTVEHGVNVILGGAGCTFSSI